MATGCAAERYRQLLYRHGHGYPFWFPEPDDNLPLDQRSTGLRVGDLVNLTDDGGWEYLWNIHLPATHPQNALVPPNFAHVALDDTRDIRKLNKCFDKDTAITTTSVKKTEIKADAGVEPGATSGIAGVAGGFEFTAEGNSGAILTLPRGGVRQNAIKLNIYLQEARKNATSWYQHINGTLQRGMHNGALYLVTGTDKCSSWGVASFATSSESHGMTLKFIVSGTASSGTSASNSWSADFGVEHRANVVGSEELSQCVFSRGYVISLRDSFFAQICGMEVKVTSLSGSESRPPFVGSSRPYSRSTDLERAVSNPRSVQESRIQDADVRVVQVPDSQPQKSVAALIGDELLNQNHNADAVIAIVHDDTWIASTRSADFLQTRDACGSFLEHLVHHAATHYRAAVVDGVCTFVDANIAAPSGGAPLARDASNAPITTLGIHKDALQGMVYEENLTNHLASNSNVPEENDPAQGPTELDENTKEVVEDGETFNTDQCIVDKIVSENPVLKRFYMGNPNYIREFAQKATELKNDKSTVMGYGRHLAKTVEVSLYQQVVYCDDSTSMMRDGVRAAQADIVKRITRITTRLLPEGEGVALRFIKQSVDDSPNLGLQQIGNIMQSASLKSRVPQDNIMQSSLWALPGLEKTEIGTYLRAKILEPMVYSKLDDKTLARPLLVSIITSKVDSALVDAIKECGNKLQAAGFPRESVKFMIGRLGDEGFYPTSFDDMRNNKEIGDIAFVARGKMDTPCGGHFKAPEADLDLWLIDILFSAIEAKAARSARRVDSGIA